MASARTETLRMDENGKLFVLEINPLPSMSDEDHFGEMRRDRGLSYDAVVKMIIEAATKRYNL